MSVDLNMVLEQIMREKGIDKERLVETIKSAVIFASKKRYGLDNIEADFDMDTSEIKLFVNKEVVKKVDNGDLEITLEDAVELNDEAEIGDTLSVPMVVEDLGRIAAHAAKQLLFQKVREAEHDVIYENFKDKKGELISGIVSRKDKAGIYVDLVKTEAFLPKREQSFRENFKRGDRIKAYVSNVKRGGTDEQVVLSRVHPGFLTKLFELEVPEINEGIVEIKGAARDVSGRSKIAVISHKKEIDPVGACVGMKGVRIQAIADELDGEKIDIVVWSDNPVEYLKNALKPAKVSKVICDEDRKHLLAIVPDDQLSLAIGKKGQNVKLAVKLIRWNVDIKKESEYYGKGEDKETEAAASEEPTEEREE
ncbi:MAG: transcription termination factor NusA [Nitrospinota bacterium]